MGNKIIQVILVIGGVVMAIIFITAIATFFVDVASTANLTQSAANWDNYPGAQAAVVAFPWWAFFIPVLVGIVAIVMILRRKVG